MIRLYIMIIIYNKIFMKNTVAGIVFLLEKWSVLPRPGDQVLL